MKPNLTTPPSYRICWYRHARSIAICIVLFCLLVPVFSFGQVSIQSLLPSNVPILTVADLWNAAVSNSSSSQYQVRIAATVTTAQGENIAEIRLKEFYVGTGITSVASANPIVEYEEYLNSELENYVRTTGAFPIDKYTVCLTISIVEGLTPASQDCSNVGVIVTPPQLISPIDNSVIREPQPLLSWIPPKPFQPGYQVSYSIKIAEILPGQSPFEAVENNPATYQEEDLAQTYLAYPPQAGSLEADKSYAWQVAGFINGVYIGSSEVWNFRFPIPEENAETISCFAVAKVNPDNGFYSASGILPVTLESRDPVTPVSFTIRDDVGQELSSKRMEIKQVDSGHYILDLTRLPSLKHNGLYSLVIHSQEGKEYRLRFKFIDPQK